MSERTNTITFCNACGTEVPDGARFCQNCGAALAQSVGGDPMPTTPTPQSSPNAPAPLPAYGFPPPIYPPPYPIVPGSAVQPTKSGKAVAGFWLGIVSIPCCVLSWIGVIVGLLGLIFGLLGLSEARRRSATTGESPVQFGYRQAIIGIVCAVAGIVASVAVLVYLLNNLDKYGIKFTR